MSDTPTTGVAGPDPDPAAQSRFAPHAGREMAQMFDSVSGRYELLNRLMTLGRDGAWRAAMWRAVPAGASVVLDLCTGDGASLGGLRRPGRLVVGVDVSRAMLEQAQARHGRSGWAPRLVAADAFHLPLRARSVDAACAAFGVRNLRPRLDALAEIARVLKSGGALVVLEAAAPKPGWFAPFHRFHLRHLIPLAGRLSDDPSAYQYLSRSIFEFGSGPEFERDLDLAGFDVVLRRAFMLGATRLWVGRLRERSGQTSPAGLRGAGGEAPLERSGAETPGADRQSLQDARERARSRSELPQGGGGSEATWRLWTGVSALVSAAILAALIVAAWMLWRELPGLALPLWQRRGLTFMIAAAILLFALRTTWLALRAFGTSSR